jgi:hypothetical protein
MEARYDGRMNKAAKTWVHQVSTIARDLGTDDEFLYHNFAGGFQNPLSTYGRDNLRFMRSVARKYDPDGLFQIQMPGGFKLDGGDHLRPGLYVQP